jgi:hypothetical protein
MRRKLSRSLRKWADLIDRHVEPTTGMNIRIDVDSSEADAKVSRLIADCERLGKLMAQTTPIPLGNGFIYLPGCCKDPSK